MTNTCSLLKLLINSLCIIGCITAQCAVAGEINIVTFYDGDTVKIDDGFLQYKLRIMDIDAPERNQSYGKKSRRALMHFCKNAEVTVQIEGVDKYGRQLGELQCNQQSVSTFMVRQGHAWFNAKYSHNLQLQWEEEQAKQNRIGLWKSKKQTPPWVWRQKHTHY
jgi:endonuclease YncB( thermonuclease family)